MILDKSKMEYKTNTLEFYIITLKYCGAFIAAYRQRLSESIIDEEASDEDAFWGGKLINFCTNIIKVLEENLPIYFNKYPGIINTSENHLAFVKKKLFDGKKNENWNESANYILKKKNIIENLIIAEFKNFGIDFRKNYGFKDVKVDDTLII
tara:strand:- start:1244 stop:1699 length:456 start_codon:yes stop_codon:yes gene_type:complete